MKKVNNSIMLTLFVLFMFINLAIPVKAEINSKLQIDVTTEKEEYTVKDEVKYSIKLDNNYGSDLTDISVKANIPQGMGVISTEGESSNDNITWRVDSIKAGETIELEFIVKVDEEQDDDVIVDVDKPDDDEQDDTEDEDKEINVGISGGNNSSKPNNMPIAGGINSILIIGIGILLVIVGGTLFIKKTKKGKKIISIFIVCTLSGGVVFGNATTVKAETIDINIVKKKNIKIGEKAYSVSVEVTAKYEANKDELVVKAERFLNNIILKWSFTEGFTYKIERGVNSDSLEIISEEVTEKIFTDILNSNEQNAYYRVLAYKDGIEVAKSAIVEILGSKDSDNDGLSDEEELRYETDINNSDTDGDGLGDYLEIYSFKTNPLVKDTDGDNLNDCDEIRCGTNSLLKDTDENGITDNLEDADNDGLNNYEEILFGSDPTNEDSDFDELSDKKEKELGTDANNLDTDNDGLLDGKEIELGTDPLNPDSNGNGILDGEEVFNIEKSPEGDEVDENVTPTISIPLKATQINTFEMKKIAEDDVFLSSDIPGYIGSGYDFTVEGDFESASLTYEFNTSLLSNEGFEPRIYYFNEESQLLEELENQIVEGNKVTATITHFSTYILLNKVEFDKVWETEIKPPSSGSDVDDTTLDIALVIDSSGSMMWNDRDNLRVETSKLFVDKLQENDRAAVVDFDRSSYLLSGFTSDKDALKGALDRIDDNGGTAIYSGIQTALDEFDSNSRNAVRNMIILTDGEDNYSYNYTSLLQRAIDSNIIIYTIGLGSSVDTNLLINIATTTGGKYYHASSAGDLVDEFDKLAGETIDFVTDTDKDGISDYYEKAINEGKLRLGNGKSLEGKLDPNNDDSDDDKVKDGKELVVTEVGSKVYIKYNSDPTKKDTDGDGYSDYEDSNPLVWDISHRDLAMCADIVYHDLGTTTKFDTTTWKNTINNRFGPKAKLEELKGWSVWDTHYSDYGLEAAVYKKDNNLIVAYRGSESNNFFDIISDWVIADILGWITGFNAQAPGAKSFIARVMKENPGYNIYVTGHSLGGSLAYNAAAKAVAIDSSRVKAVTVYNGLGLVSDVLLKVLLNRVPVIGPSIFDQGDAKKLKSIEDRVYSYKVDWDVVSRLPLTFHYGNIVKINYSKDLEGDFVKYDSIKAHSLYSIFESIKPLGRF